MKDKDIYIKILKFGISHTEGFTYDEITNTKKLKKWEKIIIDKYLNNAFINHNRNNILGAVALETMFIVIKGGKSNHKDKNTKYILNYDSRFKYIDYIELKEARESAKKTNRIAVIAIIIAVLAALI